MRKNIIEKTFNYKGYEIICTFTGWGHRCGYVVIPKDHPLYEKPSDVVNDKIDAYCGITWSDYGYPCERRDDWIIGFDCGHLWDAPDEDATLFSSYRDQYATVKDLQFVERECKRIVDQLVGMQ